MKTLKRAIAVGAVAAMASVGFATIATTGGADHTEARLTLGIDPTQGAPGTIVSAQLPAEAYDPTAGDECAASADVNQVIAAAFAALAGGGSFDAIGAELLEAVTEGPEFAGTLDSIIFPLIFADIATQEPVSDFSFWDPDTGAGTIETPADNVDTGEPLARPALYAVTGTCLGINPDLLNDAVNAAVTVVGDAIEAVGVTLATLVACLTDPDPVGCIIAALGAAGTTIVDEVIPGALATLLETVIDDDPDVAWAALYCILGDNGENCDVPPGPPGPPGPAEPIGVTPRFTG